MSRGSKLIAEERDRQRKPTRRGGEGYSAEHDKGHADELALAGATYALTPKVRDAQIGRATLHSVLWPWAPVYWRPTRGDRIRELVKAGALIAAAIDSLLAEGRTEP